MKLGIIKLTRDDGKTESYSAIEYTDRYEIMVTPPLIRNKPRKIIYKSWVDNFFLKHSGVKLSFTEGWLS